MELEKHISKLLLTNDCVIVPGFGGFMTHHVAAFYDKDVATFYPPTRTLGFSKQLTMNDSLMVQSFVEEYDMSYPEAFSHVEECVAELKHRIETYGEYEMHGLGIFTLAENGLFDFTPCEAGILTPNLYGLSSVERLFTYKTDKQNQDSHRLQSNTINAKKKIQTAESPVAVTSFVQEETNEEERIPFHIRSLIIKMAVACIVFVVLLMIPSSMGESLPSDVVKSGIDTNLLSRVMPKSVVTNAPQLKLATKHESVVQKVKETEQPSNTAIEETYYSIVLASRVTKKNAETYVENLHKDGYTDAKVLVKGKSVKVIYGKFATESEARQIRKKMTDNIEFNDSWILEVK